MELNFNGRVAIVTGAGHGLGRSHALELARRGAKVVVNDLGGARDGRGASSAASQEVVAQIIADGGSAMAHGANVANYNEVEDMVQQAMSKWGRVDILINNAGILRDKSFTKLSLDDFALVMDVHLMGSVNCTKAVWDIMKQQGYGRIVMTTSSSGLYGNFGQTNYGAAKLAVVGLMNTLGLEGKKYNIRTNALAPTAATRMTEDIMSKEVLAMLVPEAVTAGAVVLCGEHAPNRTILCAGGGGFSSAKIFETEGVWLPLEQCTPEDVIANWEAINNTDGQRALETGFEQSEKFLAKTQALNH